ncbi:MAG: hypothetical protein SPF22_01090 [Candidatus Onthovivens sp.]|nr:hypothetical protein [Candidatus Onthovivens sp.]
MANNKFDIKVFTDELNKAFTILKKEQVLEKYMKNILLNYNSIIYIGNITDEPNKYNTIYNYMYGEDNTLCNIVIFETDGFVDSATNIIPSGIHIAYPYLDYSVCIDYKYILNINNSAELLTPTQEYKTINNESILGEGNIPVQEPLVSGNNIKTVNNQSLLGAGNIDISGGSDTKRINLGTLTNEGTLDTFKYQDLMNLYYNGDLIQVQFEYNNITYIIANAFASDLGMYIIAYGSADIISDTLACVIVGIQQDASYLVLPIQLPYKFKTVNEQSILGEGNIEISGGIVAVDTLPTKTYEEYKKHLLYLKTDGLYFINQKEVDTIKRIESTIPEARKLMKGGIVGTNAYMIGGETDSSEYTKDVIKFDTVSETCTKLSITAPRNINYHTSAVIGNSIYYFGGKYGSTSSFNSKQIIKFDTVSETFTTLSSQLTDTLLYATSCAKGNYVYIFGGYNLGTGILKFNSEDETITTLLSTSPGRYDYGSSSLVGDNIYIFGTSSTTGVNQKITKFDTISETCTLLDVSIEGGDSANYITSESINNNIYIFGGRGLKLIRKFDAESETCTTLNIELPDTRNACFSCVINNVVYLIGGENYSSKINVNTIDKFEIEKKYVYNKITSTEVE